MLCIYTHIEYMWRTNRITLYYYKCRVRLLKINNVDTRSFDLSLKVLVRTHVRGYYLSVLLIMKSLVVINNTFYSVYVLWILLY